MKEVTEKEIISICELAKSRFTWKAQKEKCDIVRDLALKGREATELQSILSAVLLEYAEVRVDHGYLVTNSENMKTAYMLLNKTTKRKMSDDLAIDWHPDTFPIPPE